MFRNLTIGLAVAALVGGAIWWASANRGDPGQELLNVSYDPTRELWKDLNAQFIAHYEKESGQSLSIKQSHGGSGSQARAVIDGLEADVVTLALPSDTDAIRKKGLIAEGWERRLPNDSLPYHSTIAKPKRISSEGANMNQRTSETRREELLAKLTDAAYQAALRQGTRGTFIDLELDIWAALRRVLERADNQDGLRARERTPCPA